MQILLAEQPLLVSIMLGAVAAALLYGYLQSGQKAMGFSGIAVALLVPVVWVLASNWVTDRERIEQLIYETAAAVEAEDHERVYKIIGDAKTRAQAQAELPRYIFEMAAVNRIRSIDLIEGTFPLEADVDMSVKVDVTSKRGGMKNVRVLRRLILKFEKSGEDWVVTQYRHMPPIGGPDAFTTQPPR